MPIDNGQNSFRRGVMSLVILALLKREDMYGYQLVQETEKRSGGRLMTQEGSLYPVLYKLLDQGYISDRKVLVGKRMNRIYYHLEPAGEEKLKELIWEYEEIAQGVFQIIKERESIDSRSECPEVSVEAMEGDTREKDTEKAYSFPDGSIYPGLCF